MKYDKHLTAVAAVALSFCIYISGDAAAANPSTHETANRQATVDREASNLPSPAAARQAENMARAAVDKAQTYLLKLRQSAADAESALTEAKNSGSRAMIDGAQALYDAALRAIDKAVAASSGVSYREISAMRTSGMGWRQIAQEIGVHPGALGLHQVDTQEASEMDMATARNAATGLSEGHGTRSNGKGMGLDRADAKKGVGSGMDGNRSDMSGDISARLGGGPDGGHDS